MLNQWFWAEAESNFGWAGSGVMVRWTVEDKEAAP